METLVLDPKTGAKLRGSGRVIGLLDENGALLGHFLPVSEPLDRKDREPRISEEEIQRRLADPTGRKLADILADLERRG
jgi:hypothetical protein